MRLEVQARLAYAFAAPTQVIAQMLVAHQPGQIVSDERLHVTPGGALVEAADPAAGARLLRGTVSGTLSLAYSAVVDLAPRRALLPPVIDVAPWSELPVEVLPYLMPSRYCPVDQFLRFARRQFGDGAPGGARVLAILDWLHANVDYAPGVSTSATGAAATFIDRAGVCRDFTHLGLTLCRAAGVPARAVAVYAWALDPPDFHAVFEVYLGGGWWLVDPARLAPVAGMVRIAHGRDAADIAFLTSSGDARQIELGVSVTRLDGDFSDAALVNASHDPNTVEEAASLC